MYRVYEVMIVEFLIGAKMTRDALRTKGRVPSENVKSMTEWQVRLRGD